MKNNQGSVSATLELQIRLLLSQVDNPFRVRRFKDSLNWVGVDRGSRSRQRKRYRRKKLRARYRLVRMSEELVQLVFSRNKTLALSKTEKSL